MSGIIDLFWMKWPVTSCDKCRKCVGVKLPRLFVAARAINSTHRRGLLQCQVAINSLAAQSPMVSITTTFSGGKQSQAVHKSPSSIFYRLNPC